MQDPITLAWSAPLAQAGAQNGPGPVRQTEPGRPHCDDPKAIAFDKAIEFDKGDAPKSTDFGKGTEAPGTAAASGTAAVACPSGAYKPPRFAAAAAATAGCRHAIAVFLTFSLFLPLSALPTASSSWPCRAGLHASTGHFLRASDPPPSS